MRRQDIKRILVVSLAGIGDLIMGARALNGLRKGFPEAEVDLLVRERSRGLCAMMPGEGRVHSWLPGFGFQALRRNRSTVAAIRALRYDLGVNLYNVYSSAGGLKMGGLFRVLGVRARAGRYPGSNAKLFDAGVFENALDGLHETERQLALVRELGCTEGGTGMIRVSDESRAEAAAWLDRRHARLADTVVLHPGGQRHNRLDAAVYAAIGSHLEDARGARLVLVGGADERGWAERIASELKQPLIAAGELDLEQTAALIERSGLVVANDSGPMHLAAALNRPLVAIIGPADAWRFGPYPLERTGQVVLWDRATARCYRPHCKGHASFKRRMTAEAIKRAISDLSSGRGPFGIREV